MDASSPWRSRILNGPNHYGANFAVRKLLATTALLLAGCASTSSIDMTKVESKCGQTCSASYSECLGKFTFFPIMAQNQCTDAMKLCAQSCPPRTQ